MPKLSLDRRQNARHHLLVDEPGQHVAYLLPGGERRFVPWLGFIERVEARALQRARPMRLADITRIGVGDPRAGARCRRGTTSTATCPTRGAMPSTTPPSPWCRGRTRRARTSLSVPCARPPGSLSVSRLGRGPEGRFPAPILAQNRVSRDTRLRDSDLFASARALQRSVLPTA